MRVNKLRARMVLSTNCTRRADGFRMGRREGERAALARYAGIEESHALMDLVVEQAGASRDDLRPARPSTTSGGGGSLAAKFEQDRGAL